MSAVHKQRDVVPLAVNGGVGDSDEDEELPVLDLKVSVCAFVSSFSSCFENFICNNSS